MDKKHFYELPKEYKNPQFELNKTGHYIKVYRSDGIKEIWDIIFSGCMMTTLYKDKPMKQKYANYPESKNPLNKTLSDSFKFKFSRYEH